jgi:hypothetical protein
MLSYGVLGMASGALAGPSRVRRVASLLLALLGVVVPFTIAAEHTFWRALFALGSVLLLFRAVDLARDRTVIALEKRVGIMFSVVDLRAVVPQPSRLELRRLGLALGCGALGALGFFGALSVALAPLRWLAGAVGVYAMAESANQLMLFGWQVAGYRIPSQHRAPVLATSVSDFWSRRWNLNVRDWLHRNCMRPLAERGYPVLGVLAAFGASALLHFWFIAVALGFGWGLVMASYFVLQGLLMLAESRIRLRSWPIALRRVWTIALVGGSSPLFVEPFLRVIGR